MPTNRSLSTSQAVLATAVVWGLVAPVGAAPANPAPALAIHGFLQTAGGGPVADGDYALTVRFYASADSVEALHTDIVTAKVGHGAFGVALGQVVPLKTDSLLSGEATFVGVQVGSDPELPRVAFHTVPYAFRAQVAGDLDCTGCVTDAMLDPAILAPFAKQAELAGVALSGKYADLVAPPTLPALVPCAEGQVLRGFAGDGSLVCVPDALDLSVGSAFALSSQECKVGQFVHTIEADGKVLCGDAPTYDGSHFALSAQACDAGAFVTAIAADGKPVCAATQAPVTGSCPAGSAMASIVADGSVTCVSTAKKLVAGPALVEPGKSLTLEHNLGSLDVVVSAWVEGGDGVWDLVTGVDTASGAAANVAAAANGGKCIGQSSAHSGGGVDSGYGCSKAIDGNESDGDGTAWATKGQGVGSWLQLQFAGSYAITKMRYKQRSCACEWNRVVRLEFDDGSTQKIELGNVLGPADYALQAVTTQKVKLVVETVYGTTNNGAAEIEFWGAEAAKKIRVRKTADTVTVVNQTSVATKLHLVVSP